jgi:hypothetical protein
MTKFSAQSIEAFRTAEANRGRMVRGASFVVCVEVDDGSWCELDADDQGHAATLARNWVDEQNARGASCWRVLRMYGGELGSRPFLTVYEEHDTWEG